MGLGSKRHASAALTPGKNTGSHYKILGQQKLKQGRFNRRGF